MTENDLAEMRRLLADIARLETMMDYLAVATANGVLGGLRRSPESWKQMAAEAAEKIHNG